MRTLFILFQSQRAAEVLTLILKFSHPLVENFLQKMSMHVGLFVFRSP